MSEDVFEALRKTLVQSGVAPARVHRLTNELRDHLDDLRREELSAGLSASEAASRARARLGNLDDLADNILSRTELKSWPYRYPRFARFYLPLAYVVLLPIAPVFAGIENRLMLARWSAALMLAGLVTAGMLLGMQLAIVLT